MGRNKKKNKKRGVSPARTKGDSKPPKENAENERGSSPQRIKEDSEPPKEKTEKGVVKASKNESVVMSQVNKTQDGAQDPPESDYTPEDQLIASSTSSDPEEKPAKLQASDDSTTQAKDVAEIVPSTETSLNQVDTGNCTDNLVKNTDEVEGNRDEVGAGIPTKLEGLQTKLEARPSLKELRGGSVISKLLPREGECPTITQKKSVLENKIVGRRISLHLENQPSHEDLAGILKPSGQNISSGLQSVSRTLERRMSADIIEASIRQRKTLEVGSDPLPPVPIASMQVGACKSPAPQIQHKGSELQHRMRRDSVKNLLAGRPEPEQVERWLFGVKAGSLSSGGERSVCGRVQNVGEELEKEIVRNSVKRRLSKRPSMEDLHIRGIVSKVARVDLSQRRTSLQLAMNKDQLGYLLDGRPTGEEIKENKIWGNSGKNTAPGLHSPLRALDKNMRRASLSKSLRRRPSVEMIKEKGLLQDDFSLNSNRCDGQPEFVVSHTVDGILRSRREYAVALRVAAKLTANGTISQEAKGDLKDLILGSDVEVFGAVNTFFLDNDFRKLLAAFQTIVESHEGGDDW
eukprot:CAMPEP_0185748908 /NCGR_PEP_ID=MMETSP1174-20130828/7633_1 /TAXON_ID=35687 /ORGANISM="Dictyocha speculum, Strain CCMP1381" /LENGTH=574 /DNA_ID=CAMNT_0028424801 /DNA_START=58 /DNA_END=1779 /DNA_ORIENTATION=-